MGKYYNVTEKRLKDVIDDVLCDRSNLDRRFMVYGVMSMDQYLKVDSFRDRFHMASCNLLGIDAFAWKTEEFINRNDMDIDKEVEYRRCREGHDGMSGEEYFYYNYCKVLVDGKFVYPAAGTYSKEAVEEYKSLVSIKRRRSISDIRTLDNNNFLSPEQYFTTNKKK